MNKEKLDGLAKNPNFISSIYNYCDRWCERCAFTSRCLLYASEESDPDLIDPGVRDLNNDKFWKKLQDIFESTREMLLEWAEEAGVDLDSIDPAQAAADFDAEMKRIEQDELAQAAYNYSVAVQDWFKTESENFTIGPAAKEDGSDLQISDAIEVIQWYQFFIAVKVQRALSGIDGIDETAFEDEEVLSCDFSFDSDDDDDEQNYDEIVARSSLIDSNGSAKIALVAIDRSMAAWRALQVSLSEKSEQIKPMLLQLDRLRRDLEARFPRARDFVRPGFDEHLSEFVS